MLTAPSPRRPTTRVLAFGHYGFDNFGDDLFRTVTVDNADRLWPGSTLRVFAPGSVPGRHSRHLSSAYQSSSPVGSGIRLSAAAAGAAWAQTIVLGGGSTLQTVSGVKRLHGMLARWGLREVQGLGVSIGPFRDRTQASKVRSFVECFSRLVVRDAPSLQYADAVLGGTAVLGGDLAALHHYPRPSPHGQRLNVGIMPCWYDGLRPHAYIDACRSAVQAVEARSDLPVHVSVLTLNNRHGARDDALALSLQGELSNGRRTVHTSRYVDLGVKGTIATIAEMDLAFPARLHGGIVAYLVGIPFAILEYHQKCTDFAIDIRLPAALRIGRAGSADDWHAAAHALLDKATPGRSPASYVTRAHNAYYASHD